MDRREFLETVSGVPATTPVVAARSAPAAASGSAPPHGSAADSVAPEASPRLRENFNRGWRFARQSQGTGALGSFDRQNEAAAQVEPRFREAHHSRVRRRRLGCHQPAPYLERLRLHGRGARLLAGHWLVPKALQAGRQHSGKAVFLEFEGASSVAEFWLNGQRVGEHKGGYTSFELDVTDYVKFGDVDNVLTVKVDNLFRDTLPPTVKTDYTFYGGIYRDVWLRISELSYVSDVFWFTPSVSEQAAELRLQSRVVNKAPQAVELTLVQEVFDPQGGLVKSLSIPVRDSAWRRRERSRRSGGRVANPQLWSPDSPHLYRIRTHPAGRVAPDGRGRESPGLPMV